MAISLKDQLFIDGGDPAVGHATSGQVVVGCKRKLPEQEGDKRKVNKFLHDFCIKLLLELPALLSINDVL